MDSSKTYDSDVKSRIVLYGYPDSPYCARVQWFLEELELSYEWVEVDIVRGKQQEPNFLCLSPFGQIPCLKIGKKTFFDSMAILRYLGMTCGQRFYSTQVERMCEIDAWALASSTEVGEPISKLCWQRYWKKNFRQVEDKPYSMRLESQLKQNLSFLDARLKDSAHLCGDDISLADFSSFPLIVLHERAGVDLEGFPGIVSWLESLKHRPSLKKVNFNYSL